MRPRHPERAGMPLARFAARWWCVVLVAEVAHSLLLAFYLRVMSREWCISLISGLYVVTFTSDLSPIRDRVSYLGIREERERHEII